MRAQFVPPRAQWVSRSVPPLLLKSPRIRRFFQARLGGVTTRP
jgi:hypothetical protein